jgi:GMP synthase (glutamine-hydrolysing)
MRIQYILHADFELPGIIETWAINHQFTQKYCRPFAGDCLPLPSDFDLLILMGGPQSATNLEEWPYLKDEIALIKSTLKTQTPMLGFCLGAQLIGEALGAKTDRSPFKEVGVFPIDLTAEGAADALLQGLPQQFSVTHWHNDMPGLTPNAKVLATSTGCPRQIVRYSNLVYGFQCHPEATKKDIANMIHHCPNDLAPDRFVQSEKQFLAQDFNTINNLMIQILDNLISLNCKNQPTLLQSGELAPLLEKLLNFYQRRDWEQFHSPKNLVMDLASEVGELVDPFRWLSEEQSYHLDPKTLEEVRDEIGDVFKILVYLSYKLGIDPIDATCKKLAKMEQKYPEEACRGKALKYTSYTSSP